eukprot:313980-Rhodomonas_salina.5
MVGRGAAERHGKEKKESSVQVGESQLPPVGGDPLEGLPPAGEALVDTMGMEGAAAAEAGGAGAAVGGNESMQAVSAPVLWRDADGCWRWREEGDVGMRGGRRRRRGCWAAEARCRRAATRPYPSSASGAQSSVSHPHAPTLACLSPAVLGVAWLPPDMVCGSP